MIASWIIDFISTVIEVVSAMVFVGFFTDSDKLKRKQRFVLLFSVLMAVIVWIVHQITLFSAMAFINWIIIGTICVFVFRKRALLASVLMCCFIAIVIGLDLCMTYLVAFICQVPTSVIMDENSIYRIMVIIFSKMLMILMILILHLFLHKVTNMPLKYLIILGAATFLVFITINVSVFSVMNLEAHELSLFPILFYAVSISFLFAVFYFIIKITGYYEEKEQYAVLNTRNEMLERSLQETNCTFEAWRHSIHDYKNTIGALYLLANDGKIDELKQYLEKEDQMLKQQVFYTHTGNSFVDAIVYAKSNIAEDQGIRFTVVGTLPEGCSISGIHLASILGNLLDNALEASRDEEEPFIELKFLFNKEMLTIFVNNAFTPKLNLERTSKKKKDYHGIGLSSVRKLLDKYNGNFEIDQVNGVVRASVYLPCVNDDRIFEKSGAFTG